MYIVRLEFQEGKLGHMQTAVQEHTKRAVAAAQLARTGERSRLGTIALLPVAEPGQMMQRGIAEDTRTTVADSLLYRELLIGRAHTLLVARLGDGALQGYASNFQGLRGYEQPARPVRDGARGVAILYDDPNELDTAFDRMHELNGDTLSNTAAERRAALREQIIHVASLTELFDQPEPQAVVVPFSKSA